MSILFKDGTPVNPPPNPLKAKWDKLFPSCATDIEDYYRCIYCGKCPKGDDWECPEEDKAVYEAWRLESDRYYEAHGGFENVIMPFNINIRKEIL